MSKSTAFCLLVMSTLVIPTEARTQALTPCQDPPVSGVIGVAGEIDEYTFTASGGEMVSVTVSDGAILEERWRLLDPDMLPVGIDCTSLQCERLLPPKSGTYKIQVFDFGSDEVGTYNLSMHFVSGAASCGEPIDCDQTVASVQINVAGDTDTYKFDALAGEAVVITVANISAIEERLTLFDPNGFPVFSDCFTRCTSGSLPQSGTYTIKVFDAGHNQTGSYALSLDAASDTLNGSACGQTVGCGTTVAAAQLDVVGDMDAYTFNAASGDSVALVLESLAFDEQWQVFDPNGFAVTLFQLDGTSGTNCFGAQICRTGSLSPGGTYSIHVFDSGTNQSGAYNLTLEATSGSLDGSACGQPIACDTTATGQQIDVRGDTDAYVFEALSGDAVHIAIGNLTGGSLDEGFTLFAPNGTPVSLQNTFQSETGPLPQTGVYTILAWDFSHDEVGPYNLSLDTLSEQLNGNSCGAEISCGETIVDGDFDVIGDIDTYTFTASAGDAVSVTVNSTTSALEDRWGLFDPNGTQILDECNTQCQSGLLPLSGGYTIRIYEDGRDEIGPYHVTLQSLASILDGGYCGQGIRCGGTGIGGLNAIGDTDAYAFEAEAGDEVSVSIAADCATAIDTRWSLYDPSGDPVFSNCSAQCNAGPLPLSGTYTVEVFDQFHDETGKYTLSVSGIGLTACGPPARCPVGTDGDADGRCDDDDNCSATANESQIDTDLDGFGNHCDADYDGNLLVGGSDYLQLGMNFGKTRCDPLFDPDVDNGDGAAGGPDYLLLGMQFGATPGPSGLSCAGSPPCP